MEHQGNYMPNSNVVTINGDDLTIAALFDIAYNNKPVVLSEESIKKILTCREMVEKKICEGEIMYGINTGIGEFSETILDDSQIEEFQKYLIYNYLILIF